MQFRTVLRTRTRCVAVLTILMALLAIVPAGNLSNAVMAGGGLMPYIYTANADGTGERLLSLTPGTDPALSLDGKVVFVGMDTGRLMVWSQVGSIVDLGVTGSQPVWSPDGTQIAYTKNYHSRDRIHLIRVNSRVDREVPLPTGWRVFDPAWVDANTLLFTSFEGGNGDREIYRSTINGTGLTNLTNNTYVDQEATLGPDGVYFKSYRSPGTEPGPTGIYKLVAGVETRLTDVNANNPTVAPDGTLAYWKGAYNPWDYTVIKVVNGSEVQIALGTKPRWSPDGGKVVYYRWLHGRLPGENPVPPPADQYLVCSNNSADWYADTNAGQSLATMQQQGAIFSPSSVGPFADPATLMQVYWDGESRNDLLLRMTSSVSRTTELPHLRHGVTLSTSLFQPRYGDLPDSADIITTSLPITGTRVETDTFDLEGETRVNKFTMGWSQLPNGEYTSLWRLHWNDPTRPRNPFFTLSVSSQDYYWWSVQCVPKYPDLRPFTVSHTSNPLAETGQLFAHRTTVKNIGSATLTFTDTEILPANYVRIVTMPPATEQIGTMTFRYVFTLQPGESRTISFGLKAWHAGYYASSAQVCVSTDCASNQFATTNVTGPDVDLGPVIPPCTSAFCDGAAYHLALPAFKIGQ